MPLGELPRPGSLFVVVSGDDADVPPTDLAVPLVTRLAAGQLSVLAAQPARPPVGNSKGKATQPEEFVAAVRAGALSNRVSSVDNLDDYRGRVASVLALRDLRDGKLGHYGFGPGAQLLPEAANQ